MKIQKALIEKFKADVIRLNNQRIRWLTFSVIVFFGVALIVYFLDKINNLHSQSVRWLVVSVGLLLIINWWYWTIVLVRNVLKHQHNTIIVLQNLTSDIKEIKTDINKLNQKDLIK